MPETARDAHYGPRFLVVGPSWVGDMVMAQSLFIALRRRYPRAAVDVLAPAWSRPILERMDEVREAIDMPLGHGQFRIGTRRAVGRRLRRGGYDRAIVLPRAFKAALAPFFARIPRRTGYRGELRYGLLNDIRLPDRKRLPQTVQRFVALGLEPGEPLPPETPQPSLRRDAGNRARLVEALGLELDRPAVGLIPGAEYGPAKRWPATYFRELAGRLVDSGREVWVFGSPAERGLGESVIAGLPGQARNLCGRTRLEDVVDLLTLTERVVTNDSGLMHVAAATGADVIAVYGSSSPAYTPPLTDRARIVHLGLACSPCFERHCPLGHTNCLRGIPVDRVYRYCLEEWGRSGPRLGVVTGTA